jgi:hypothetical protein
MKWSVSQLKNWLRCQTYCYYHDVLRRGVEGTSAALELGTMFHLYMEAKLKDRPPEGVISANEKAMEEWAKLLPFAQAWTPPADWEIKFVEKALEWPLGFDILLGRLDALVWWNDGWWSLQWKTTGQNTNLELLGEQVRVGFHECAYQWLAEQNGYTPFKGTILVTAKKLSQKAINEGRNPIAPPQYLFRSRAMVDERIKQMRAESHRMGLILETPPYAGKGMAEECKKLIFKNVEQCGGMFHNSRCPYWDVCHEQGSIDSSPFVDLPNRYESEEEE